MQRLISVGKVQPKGAREVTQSRLGIGFEKLDRDVFDPEKAYDKVAALGVKWVRLQSGWQRTERARGVYDFGWLDKIVDHLLARGMRPWLCLCYGNDLYTESAKAVFGAVGCPPIATEAERQAWHDYVVATVTHFKGRISDYEVWNEPDGKWCWKHGPDGTELGQFTAATARAVKEADPDAYVIGVALCMPRLDFITEAFEAGMGDYIDAVSFHEYTPDERRVPNRVASLRALAHRYNPKIEIIQGESGSQSRAGGHGALWPCGWTPRKQAKQLLRHMVADLCAGVKFTSYFSALDMVEALNGTAGEVASYLDYGYFGVLGAEFDAQGRSTGTYTEKPSYYALQALASVFSEQYRACELPILFIPEKSDWVYGHDLPYWELSTQGFCREDGACAYVYWCPTPLMTTEYESTVTLECAALPEQIRLVDLYDGTIYALPDTMVERDEHGVVRLVHLPVRDYPMVLTFGDFLQ